MLQGRPSFFGRSVDLVDLHDLVAVVGDDLRSDVRAYKAGYRGALKVGPGSVR